VSGVRTEVYSTKEKAVRFAPSQPVFLEPEKALASRARELFHIAGDNIEEEQALDDTMYALHALRNTSQTSHCIPHRIDAA
jgi:hypothetical protein